MSPLPRVGASVSDAQTQDRVWPSTCCYEPRGLSVAHALACNAGIMMMLWYGGLLEAGAGQAPDPHALS